MAGQTEFDVGEGEKKRNEGCTRGDSCLNRDEMGNGSWGSRVFGMMSSPPSFPNGRRFSPEVATNSGVEE